MLRASGIIGDPVPVIPPAVVGPPQPVLVAPQLQPAAAVPSPPVPLDKTVNMEDLPDDLGLPWLKGTPQPPRRRVQFDMGPRGCMSAHYHHVIYRPSHDLLTLVLDNRHNGTAFLPPETKAGEMFQVTVYAPESTDSDADRRPDTKLFHVFVRPGLAIGLGCLDLINLVVVDR
jgi:hypothetical protein